jgi:hypothetical protein
LAARPSRHAAKLCTVVLRIIMHVMKHLLLIVWAPLVMASATSSEERKFFPPLDGVGTGVYRCTIIDALGITGRGTFDRDDSLAQDFAATYREFLFDADHGTFVTPHQTTEWAILRFGSSQWDLVAHLPGQDEWFNMIRIEVWNTPIKFSMTDGNNFFSGLCERAE